MLGLVRLTDKDYPVVLIKPVIWTILVSTIIIIKRGEGTEDGKRKDIIESLSQGGILKCTAILN